MRARSRIPRLLGARRRAALPLALLALLAAAPAASADTQFGGDPSQAVTAGLSCQLGAPTLLGFEFPYFGTAGSQSCSWGWNSPGNGSDIVPLPVSGGSGTITSVTLPAMANPGPMQVLVLTAALAAGSEPARPDYACCQIKAIGPTFTVPAGTVTTVPQNLAVSATESADLSVPGDTSFGDLLAISVLSPTASLPLRYTGNTEANSSFDGDYAYYPAPKTTSGEFSTPYNVVGFQLLARFNLATAGAPAPPAGGGAPAPATGAKGGLELKPGALRVGPDGRTVVVGQATNPPLAGTAQTLTVPAAGGAARSAATKAGKPVLIGRGSTRVPAGKTVPIALKLNGKGRARLKKGGALKATLTVVATKSHGEKQTARRAVTVKRAAQKK